ncbi:MAG: 4-hydroxy-3-methylbut-2-enyl diphosphate reductase, partial [Spirochaetota bacterium]|nr:4-hydroxy-3-methylbut-2-enyl diphosphate reductase [Spirochaetota bacterium]
MAGPKKVVRSDVMGFCMGVKAVMKKVDEQVDLQENSNLYTYGPLIHNPQEIERLSLQGVKPIESPGEVDGGTIIIRAHGIHPLERRKFIDEGFKIVEGTCPRVLKSQKTVSEHSRDGWFIVIVGDKGHGEVKA